LFFGIQDLGFHVIISDEVSFRFNWIPILEIYVVLCFLNLARLVFRTRYRVGDLLGVWVLFDLFLGNDVLRLVRCVSFLHHHYKYETRRYQYAGHAHADHDLAYNTYALIIDPDEYDG
jgi:hypothetical protein